MISALNLLKDTNAQTDIVCLSALSELSDFVIQNVKTSDLQNDAGFLSSCYPRNDVTYDTSISGFWIQPNKVNVIQYPAGLPENAIVSCNSILSAYSEENDYQIVVMTPEKTCIDLKMLVERDDEVVEDELVTSYFGKFSPNQPYFMSVHKGDVCINQSYGMQQRNMTTLTMRENIGKTKYGIDYTEQLSTNCIFAIDNCVNVVEIGDEADICNYKIIFPQFTSTAGSRRLRKFSVAFNGNMTSSRYVLLSIPFVDVDNKPIMYSLSEGVKWSDIYMMRKNFIYEFTETNESVFKIYAKEYVGSEYDEYGIVIDVPLFNWRDCTPFPKDSYDWRFDSVNKILYDIFVNGPDYSTYASPSIGVRAAFLSFLTPCEILGRSYDCHVHSMICHGYSGVPTTMQDFLEFLFMSAFPDSQYCQSYFENTEKNSGLLKYIIDNVDYRIVIDDSNLYFLRIMFKGQQPVTFPFDFTAQLEMAPLLTYMQLGKIPYTMAEKSNSENIKAKYEGDTGGYSYKTLYLMSEISAANPALIENSPAMFYEYNNELSSYKPAYLDPMPDTPANMVSRYTQIITFYAGTKIGVFGNELSVFTGPEIRDMLQQMKQQQNS